jgi:hypothetical protein
MNTLLELASKSSKAHLQIHAFAVQITYWGVVVFNPYAAIERLATIVPFYQQHKSEVIATTIKTHLQIPASSTFVLGFHLEVMWDVSYAVALCSLGYMDRGMHHWKAGLKKALELGMKRFLLIVMNRACKHDLLRLGRNVNHQISLRGDFFVARSYGTQKRASWSMETIFYFSNRCGRH